MIEPAMNYNFDSHKYVKALQAKGFKEEQAEVLIDAILKSKEYDLSNLATKDQLAVVEAHLDAKIDKESSRLTEEISKVREEVSKVREEVSKLRADFSKWMMSTVFAVVAMCLTITGIVIALAFKS